MGGGRGVAGGDEGEGVGGGDGDDPVPGRQAHDRGGATVGDAVERATGVRPSLPTRVGDLFDREERYATLPATFEAITAYITERAKPSA